MRDVQTQVIGVESSQTRTGKTMYSINLANGEKVTSFELPEATKAAQSNGQPVTVRIEDVQKGNSTYHNLKGIFLSGEAVAPILAAPGTAILGAPAVAPGIEITPRSSGGMSTEDKIRVTKLACIGSATQLLSGTGASADEVLEVAKVFFAAATSQAASQVVPETAAAVVAALPPGTAIQVGTEGLEAAAAPASLPWAV